MINSVNLSGYISNEIKYAVSNSGTQMAQFNLAVQRSFKNQEGKRDVDFINISAFGKTAATTIQESMAIHLTMVRLTLVMTIFRFNIKN